MSSPAPRRRRGAHRTRAGFVAALMPSVLAVLAVSALVTSLAVWRGQDPVDRDTTTAAAGAGDREALSLAPSSSGGSTTTSPAQATSSTAPTKDATTAPAETAQPTSFDVEVVVLNQSTRRGLAGTVADVLRAEGWAVPFVGNFHGVVPATTVYYPPGLEAAARAAAATLPTAQRVRPSFGNLSATRLTVVVTSSYPG